MSGIRSLIISLISCLGNSRQRRSLLGLCHSINYWHDNPEPTAEDIEIADRIIAAYRRQAAHPKAKRPEHSGIWEGLAYREKIRYWKLMERGEVYGLAAMLASFERNPGVRGINTFTPCLLTRWGLRENCAYVTEAYKRFATITKLRQETPVLGKLSLGNRVGNPYMIEIEGEEVALAPMLFLKIAHEILSHLDLDPSAKNCFLNIGGGFGGLEAHLGCLFEHSTFVILDLPETLIFQMYCLSTLYPGKRLFFYAGEGNLGRILEENDIILIPDWAAADIPDNSVDVIINRNALENIPRAIGLDYARMAARILRPGGALYSNDLWEDQPRAKQGDEGNGILSLLRESGALGQFSEPRFITSPPTGSGQMVCSAVFRRRRK